MTRRLGDLAVVAGATLRGDAEVPIIGVATLASAGDGQIAFLANPKYRSQLADSAAAAVILDAESAAGWSGPALVAENPYLAYARVAAEFDQRPELPAGIHPSAVIHADATVASTARIAAGVVVNAHAEIGEHVEIGANCVIGDACRIGPHTRLAANVTLYHSVVIGSRCLLHSGVVIGADGFGQAPDGKGGWEKVPQLGSVRIEDDVEIGANTTVDRGALDDTVIGQGVKLDNQIQIAHNVVIGSGTAIAGATAIAGSTRIGRQCMIAGGVGIAGHLEIADGVTVLAMTFVTHSIRSKGTYAGSHPIEDVRSWRKNSARLRRLDELARRVDALEKQLNGGKQADE